MHELIHFKGTRFQAKVAFTWEHTLSVFDCLSLCLYCTCWNINICCCSSTVCQHHTGNINHGRRWSLSRARLAPSNVSGFWHRKNAKVMRTVIINNLASDYLILLCKLYNKAVLTRLSRFAWHNNLNNNIDGNLPVYKLININYFKPCLRILIPRLPR